MHDVIERAWGWDERFQHADFERRFRVCTVTIVELHGERVGGLFLERRPDALHIAEVQIAPEHQGRGFGGSTLRHAIADAVRKGEDVTLAVAQTNPRAQRLYERLGFQVITQDKPFVHMLLPAR